MNKNGLKPCPFCARQPITYQFEAGIWVVVCKCGAESPNDSRSEIGARRIWNRRRLDYLRENEK